MERQSLPGGPGAANYSNPPVEDGINNPPESQLRAFFVNLGLVALALALLFAVLNAAAGHFAGHIPFSWEKRVAGRELFASVLTASGEAKQRELRRMAATLAAAMDLPDGMDVAVFYNSMPVRNAFATLGGNIVVFRGLLELMESEDELAMVLAHEIAHVRHRDLVKGLVRVAGLALLSSGLRTGGMEQAMNWGTAGYSRAQEEEADSAAVRALGKVYGHAGGAAAFFKTMAERIEGRDAGGKAPRLPAMSASHPDTLLRLQRMREAAARLGLPPDGDLSPLSEVLADGESRGRGRNEVLQNFRSK